MAEFSLVALWLISSAVVSEELECSKRGFEPLGTGCPCSQPLPLPLGGNQQVPSWISHPSSLHNQEPGYGNKPAFYFPSLGSLVTSLGFSLWLWQQPDAKNQDLLCCMQSSPAFSSPLKHPQLHFKTQHFSGSDPGKTKGCSRVV